MKVLPAVYLFIVLPPFLLAGYLYTVCARAGFVAQIFNLPYRRLAVGRVREQSHASAFPNGWQSATLRYSRVQLCATMGRQTRTGKLPAAL